ncbi:hypothetical protein F383_18415 [Gossypium arboreum]|uniref:Uncharacterized protein n=1 Tax=Gossypium arboreum TaxID=29729 RepID=A0A0B0MED9_GOSAR|nr:hypothetical protein F383_37167 [Gossypium arboreum]KHG15285.1 hypothetical protein F383_18415 [Gossypium arboreum]
MGADGRHQIGPFQSCNGIDRGYQIFLKLQKTRLQILFH